MIAIILIKGLVNYIELNALCMEVMTLLTWAWEGLAVHRTGVRFQFFQIGFKWFFVSGSQHSNE